MMLKIRSARHSVFMLWRGHHLIPPVVTMDADRIDVSLLNISVKTPQLIGIIAGCTVFVITISVVVYLLYASGSFSKLAQELVNNDQTNGAKGGGTVVTTTPDRTQPELYENLLAARMKLSLKPALPILTGQTVRVKPFTASHRADVAAVSDGRAIFHESAYDPTRLTVWFDMELCDPAEKSIVGLLDQDATDRTHLCIADKELDKIVGTLSLVDNSPRNLSVRIENIWITPAFQGKHRAHEAILLVLQWLHESGYRRITAEVDERHVIGRKFLQRCGFECEAVLRKHRILHNRNSNTALYTVLNSDFPEVERRLKMYLGLPVTAPQQRATAIGSFVGVGTAGQVHRRETAEGSSAKSRRAKKTGASRGNTAQ